MLVSFHLRIVIVHVASYLWCHEFQRPDRRHQLGRGHPLGAVAPAQSVASVVGHVRAEVKVTEFDRMRGIPKWR